VYTDEARARFRLDDRYFDISGAPKLHINPDLLIANNRVSFRRISYFTITRSASSADKFFMIRVKLQASLRDLQSLGRLRPLGTLSCVDDPATRFAKLRGIQYLLLFFFLSCLLCLFSRQCPTFAAIFWSHRSSSL